MRPFIIDCDTGRDDALTLWLAVKAGLPLTAVVTSYGNTVVANVTDNTARVLSFVDRDDLPLFAGAARPFAEHRLFEPVVSARQKRNGNGLCNIELPKARRRIPENSSPEQLAAAISDLATIHGALDYFITGPATNFASMLRVLGPSLKATIASVTMLGGKFDPLWSEIPAPDFNIASDPYAVWDIMQSRIPLRFVPLNATWPINLPLEQVETLVAKTPLATVAKELMVAHCRYFSPEPIFRFHDPSIVLAAQAPDSFRNVRLNMIHEETMQDFGRLIEAETGIPCTVYETGPTAHVAFRKTILHWLGFEDF
jgi:inosine-uridine nucleoside N-ribohydrolase